MRELSATYKIITPMFLGDSDQNANDIRPSSIKGSLRFWWRALQWGTAMQVAKGDEPAALRWLHAREAALLGLPGALGSISIVAHDW